MGIKYVFLRLFILALFINLQQGIKAAGESYIQTLSGNIKKGDSCVVIDDKFLNLALNKWNMIQHLSVHNIISFELRYDTSIYFHNKPFTCTLNVSVKYFTSRDQHTPQEINNIDLVVKYDTAKGKYYPVIAQHKFKNAFKVVVTVNSIQSPEWGASIPAIFRLKNQILVQRRYPFNPHAGAPAHAFRMGQLKMLPAFVFAGLFGFIDADKVNDQAIISWDPNDFDDEPMGFSNPAEYDVEWTYIDRFSKEGNDIFSLYGDGTTIPVSKAEEWMRNNSTRVTVPLPPYIINLPYPEGYLLVRVRGIGYTQDDIRVLGDWQYEENDEDELHYAICVPLDTDFQPDMNWQYTASFAEEGKRRELITYFDATLRNRQLVTISNSDQTLVPGSTVERQETAIVQETIYDDMGRGVMNVLPAPTDNKSIRYYPGFNKNNGGQPYSHTDISLGITTGNICRIGAGPMSTSSGASRYFSPQNPFQNDDQQYYFTKYVPDAELYPYTLVELTPDNTGRIRRQGGVGKAFQPGASFSPGPDHTTRYFYSKPSPKELYRLFGSEAGNASHYLKNMVVDPNGQISVSYLNSEGKTIATALAGKTLNNLETLPGASEGEASKRIDQELIGTRDFSRDAGQLMMQASATFTAAVSGNYVIHYTVNPAALVTYHEPAHTVQFCNNCYYEILVEVRDDCGNLVGNTTSTPFSGNDVTCHTEPPVITSSLNMNIARIGEYSVTYTLRLTENVIKFHEDYYIDNNIDLLKLKDFFVKELNKLDLLSCYNECQTCKTLGTEQEFRDKIKKLIEGNPSFEGIQLNDLPDDQINQWIHNTWSELNDNCSELSCDATGACEDYLAQMKIDVMPGGQYAPYTYNEETGQYAYTERAINVLQYYQDASFPDLTFNMENGASVQRKALSESDLIREYLNHPEWVDDFVKKHIEYCSYEWCKDQGYSPLNKNNEASYNFDKTLREVIETGTDAVNRNFYDRNNMFAIMDDDPFFSVNGRGASLASQMQSDLSNLSTVLGMKMRDPVNGNLLPTKDIFQLIDWMLYCKPTDPAATTAQIAGSWTNCPIIASCRSVTREWELYRNYYLKLKSKYVRYVKNQVDPSCTDCFIGDDVLTAGTCVEPGPLSDYSVAMSGLVGGGGLPLPKYYLRYKNETVPFKGDYIVRINVTTPACGEFPAGSQVIEVRTKKGQLRVDNIFSCVCAGNPFECLNYTFEILSVTCVNSNAIPECAPLPPPGDCPAMTQFTRTEVDVTFNGNSFVNVFSKNAQGQPDPPIYQDDGALFVIDEFLANQYIFHTYFCDYVYYIHNSGPVTRPVNVRVRRHRYIPENSNVSESDYFWLTINPGEDRVMIGMDQSAYDAGVNYFPQVEFTVVEVQCPLVINPPPATCPSDPRYQQYSFKNRVFNDYMDEQSLNNCLAGEQTPPPTEQENLERMRATATEDLKVMKNDWIERLKNVRTAEAPAFNAVTDLVIDDLADALYKVSERWIAIAPQDNIRPASTLPAGELSSRGHNSFSQAFAQVIGLTLMQQGFSHELLDNPYPHDKTPILANPNSGDINSTICTNLDALRTRYNNSGFTGSFHDYLKEELDEDFVLTETELTDLETRCSSQCRYTETPVFLPAAFVTPVPANADHPFVECNRIATLRAAFNITYPTLIPQSKLYALLFTNSLNQSLGYSLPYHAYEEFTAACNNVPAPVLYNKPASPLFLPDEFACTANQLRSAYERAGQEYERYIVIERKKFRNAYISTCLANKASANLEGEVFEYHYTLYYYDQAGNLVKTIPPEGVRLLSDEEIDIVDKNRDFDPSTCLATSIPTTENKAATFTAFSTALENASGKSLELWINNTGTSSDRHIRFITPDNKYMVQAAIHDGKLWTELYTLEREGNEVTGISLTNQAVADIGTITLQPWTHLVIQSTDFTGATWDVYLDGRLLTLLPTADEPPYPFAWEIGAGSTLPAEETAQLKHLRVYNDVISASQVLNNYNNACLAPVGELQNVGDPLLVWGRFNIPTLCNTAGTVTAPNRGSLLITANRDHRTKFFEHIKNDFTVELWVNPQETHEIDVESQTGAGGTNGQKWAIYPTNGGAAAAGRAYMGISVGTNGVSVYEHADAYLPPLLVWQGAVTAWTHMAVVYTNKTPSLYINGQFVKQGLASTKQVVSPSYNFGGGAFGFMPGGLDEARIWSVARTAQEIADNYQLGVASSTSNLAGYWPMSPADGMQLEDYSCNSNPFTIDEGQQWLNTGAPVTDQIRVEYAEHFLVPQHGLPTTYAYNSLNQVIKQITPDAGVSELFYDRLGRFAASQNAEQLVSSVGDADNRFTYTKYDALGRVVEVGEKTGGSFMSEGFARDKDILNNWLSSGVDRQVTQTIYDASPSFAPGLLTNLRKRIAASVFRETTTGPVEQATYYSYDISGYVKTLYQEIKKLKEIDPVTGIKRIDYEYDLISSKVNKIKYQENKGDQFYYDYQYDADNRLVAARTSRDAQTWNTEATYRYYLHGPLARMELGENRVQGLDYTYTLQGWLKGINSIELDPDKDMSQDGKQGSTKFPFVGRDALAFNLGYYLGDYKPIGSTGATAFGLPYIPQIGLPVEGGDPVYSSETGNPLFNGNVTHTTLALSKLDNGAIKGYTYRYDQLNRIKQMRMHAIPTSVSSWGNTSIIQDYREDISYDANGNILSYLRNGNTVVGLPMDNLEYKYNRDANGRLVNNKLTQVADNVTGDGYDSDIPDGQTGNNYVYDNIGNLIADQQERLTSIRWTAYGKLSRVFKDETGPGPFGAPVGQETTIAYKYGANGHRVSKAVTKKLLTEAAPPPPNTTTIFYVRDALGNVLAVYEITEGTVIVGEENPALTWKEQHLYGSGRLGIWKPEILVTENWQYPGGAQQFNVGQRVYELKNHLDNVLATISDDRVAFDLDNNQQVDYYEPVVLNANDYYPFGMLMPGREYSIGNDYRYGFNGKEKDTEGVIQYDYGFRIYDPRLGRFKSVDPLTQSFPWYTPYQFAGNKPIVAVDLDGLEEKVATTQYTAADGTALKLPNDAKVELSTGIMANHRVVQTNGEEFVFPYNFADFFPKGTVGNFTYKGINYAGAYDETGFLGYFGEGCNCYWDGPEIWFPNYKPLFNHEGGGLIDITDPSGGVIADAFQIADYIESATGVAGGVKVITKASIPLLIKAIKNFRDDLTKAGKSILKDKASHILQDKHLWDDVVKGTGNKFDEVQKVIAEVAEKGDVIIDKGSKGAFGSIVKRVKGKWVELRFGKSSKGGYRINDGWVADKVRSAELDKIFGPAKDSAAPGFNSF
jgi:RHS repeat-associated protein